MDMNKPYIIGSDAYDLIDELKRSKEVNNTEPEPAPKPKAVPKPKPVSETIRESEIVSTPVKPIKTEAIEEKLISESVLPPVKDYTESENLPETETINPKPVSNSGTVKEGVPENNDSGTIKEPLNETKPVD